MQISGSRLVSVRLSIVCIELSGISVAELLWHRRLCAVLAMTISCCVGVSLWFMIEVFLAFPVEFKGFLIRLLACLMSPVMVFWSSSLVHQCLY